MKQLQNWLAEYGESHQNSSNKKIHWICVPLIFFSIVGFLFSIELPFQLNSTQPVTVAHLALLLVFVYYFLLSWRLSIGMFVFGCLCLLGCRLLTAWGGVELWKICIIIFSLAWIGQFYGHKIEGKKPSFLKDIQFLLIGPAWLMSFVYQKLHISY